MNITISVVVMVVAYVLGAITKIFIKNVPNRFIPIQNVIIGFFSGILCYFLDLNVGFVESIILCLISTMSAGGLADLVENKGGKLDVYTKNGST